MSFDTIKLEFIKSNRNEFIKQEGAGAPENKRIRGIVWSEISFLVKQKTPESPKLALQRIHQLEVA